jgi:thiosulfate dehydrogenase (quinone)
MKASGEAAVRDGWGLAGMLATPIRLVMGWMFFSAFWRRVVLAPPKLDPDSAAYVGEKFNHFLPHALWIKPLLDYLLLHADVLYAFLIVFTIVEGLVGLSLLTGLGTRLGALGVALLSWGILMGAGWIGTTCLDEWQIGATGAAAGLTVMLAGGGPWSLDAWWQRRWPKGADVRWLRWLSSGPIGNGRSVRSAGPVVAAMAILALGMALYTNQAFAGGVWGKLHNASKTPHLTLSQVDVSSAGTLDLTVYRDGGPDTYGAFIVRIVVQDGDGNTVETVDASELSRLPASAIDNHYLVKAHTGPNGLVVPLGAQARIHVESTIDTSLPRGNYSVVVEDVSGITWTKEAALDG